MVDFTLCGVPAPNVTWWLYEEYAGYVSREKIDSYIYKYSIVTKVNTKDVWKTTGTESKWIQYDRKNNYSVCDRL